MKTICFVFLLMIVAFMSAVTKEVKKDKAWSSPTNLVVLLRQAQAGDMLTTTNNLIRVVAAHPNKQGAIVLLTPTRERLTNDILTLSYQIKKFKSRHWEDRLEQHDLFVQQFLSKE